MRLSEIYTQRIRFFITIICSVLQQIMPFPTDQREWNASTPCHWADVNRIIPLRPAWVFGGGGSWIIAEKRRKPIPLRATLLPRLVGSLSLWQRSGCRIEPSSALYRHVRFLIHFAYFPFVLLHFFCCCSRCCTYDPGCVCVCV